MFVADVRALVAGTSGGLDPAHASEAAGRLVALVLGRLLRQALQRADADQPGEREATCRSRWSATCPGLGGRRSGDRADDHRRRGHGRRRPSAAPRTSGSILMVNGILYVTAPDNAWAIDARDGHELWHYFWKTRGGTHIGNRGVGDVGQLALHRHAGRLPRLARRADRQGALAQGNRAASASSTSRRRRRSSSATTCSSAPATISTRPGSCSRSIRRPASCSGSSTRCR